MTEEKALDWDAEIENDGEAKEFYVFPDGSEVDFEVDTLTKDRSEKLDCPMAKLKLILSDGEHENSAFDNLILHTKAEWKLCQFFLAIGQRQHGEKLKPDWEAVEGSTGRCKVGIRTYKKKNDKGELVEREANEVIRYLEPEGSEESDSSANYNF